MDYIINQLKTHFIIKLYSYRNNSKNKVDYIVENFRLSFIICPK